jgi:hypothetical protein
MQAYVYSSRFPDDTLGCKLLVGFFWTLETMHMIFVISGMWVWIIADYANPAAIFGKLPWPLPGYMITTIVIEIGVQMFFTYRIYTLSRSLLVTSVPLAIGLLRMGLCAAVFAVGFHVSSMQDYITRWNWLYITAWITGAVHDIVIAGCMVYLLRSQRDRGHKATTAVLDRLIKWTIETGAMTSVFSLIVMICFHTMPGNMIWVALFTIQARVPTNSMLASLNSRSALRQMPGPSEDLSSSLPLSFARQTDSATHSATKGPIRLRGAFTTRSGSTTTRNGSDHQDEELESNMDKAAVGM